LIDSLLIPSVLIIYFEILTMKNLLIPRNRYYMPGICLLMIMLFSARVHAQGDLMIYPKRILFEGNNKRSHEINLANSGKDSARYILSVVQIRMKDDGSFEQITAPDPGQNFADKYFRIFPRNVLLGPNEAQTVKVQLINTADIQPGEYRSHLYIRAEEEKAPLGEKDNQADPTAINIKLVAIFGISIPVIIRSGENTTEVKLSGASFHHPKDSTPFVHFTFNRSGNMSAYGDIEVDYISPEGKTIKVGSAKGIAVYTPSVVRHFNLGLQVPPNVDLRKGSLKVSYSYEVNKKERETEQVILLKPSQDLSSNGR
jgi:hypothetical protein